MAKIFVLEDDNDIREVVEYLLQSEGYQVSGFENVRHFMDRDVTVLPDLFLLDVMLPDGSGLEVCRELRANLNLQHIPIIIMSAHASFKQVTETCDADSFINKPFEIDFLISEIGRMI